MAATYLADVITPEVFGPYVLERTAEKSAFYRSGIVKRDPYFDALAAGPGSHADLPFFQDVDQARQIMAGGSDLTVNHIHGVQDIARIQVDAQSWGVNDLARLMAGADPMKAIGEFVSDYWARKNQDLLIASLKGMFGAATMSGNLSSIAVEVVGNVTAATKLNGSTFIDACALLGDRSDRLTCVCMHSAVEAALRKADLIDYIPESQAGALIRTFQGRRVIVDDGCPARAGSTSGMVYRTYLFGEGAFAEGQAPLSKPVDGGQGTEGVELFRAALGSDTVLINRRRFIMHPRGVKFTSTTCTGASPTDAELETSNNWVRVYEAKNVPIVAIDHNP